MLRSYRSILLALVGLVAVGALACAGYYQLQSADRPSYADYKYQPARDAVAFSLSKNPKVTPKPYQPNCQNPQGRDDADLCAQWAAVQASFESNRLTRLSITITGLEFGALIISLFFTGWAALAAAKAARIAEEATKDADEALTIARKNADAAERQVAVSVDTARRQLRPYISVSGMSATHAHMTAPPMVRICLSNRGQTPAYNLKSTGVIRFEESEIPDVEEFDWSTVSPVTAGPQVTNEVAVEVEPGETRSSYPFYCIAEARYEDGFGKCYVLRVTVIFEESSRARAYQTGNYEKELL